MRYESTWDFTADRFILCEGENDKHFLEILISHKNLPPFQVMHADEANGGKGGGRSGFGPALEGFDVHTGFEKLRGIAIVTDNDTPSTCPDLERELSRYGYVQSGSDCLGTLNSIPVRLILLPNRNEFGDLETLCLPALYDKWASSEKCVTEYLRCTAAALWRRQNKIPKAKVRSIISGYYEADPNKGLGYLFKEEPDLLDDKCFDELADILRHFDEIVRAVTR